jgi:hypothetical protein
MYYRSRYIDPTIGHWSSRDAMGFPDGPNTYRFVLGQPTNSGDPMGYAPFVVLPSPTCQGSNKWFSTYTLANVIRAAAALQSNKESFHLGVRKSISAPKTLYDFEWTNVAFGAPSSNAENVYSRQQLYIPFSYSPMKVVCACDGENRVSGGLLAEYDPDEKQATIAERASKVGFDVTLLHEWTHHASFTSGWHHRFGPNTVWTFIGNGELKYFSAPVGRATAADEVASIVAAQRGLYGNQYYGGSSVPHIY